MADWIVTFRAGRHGRGGPRNSRQECVIDTEKVPRSYRSSITKTQRHGDAQNFEGRMKIRVIGERPRQAFSSPRINPCEGYDLGLAGLPHDSAWWLSPHRLQMVGRARRPRTRLINGVGIRPAMHPVWRRCSFLKYSRYSRSSRLASRAPRRPRCCAPIYEMGSSDASVRVQRFHRSAWAALRIVGKCCR